MAQKYTMESRKRAFTPGDPRIFHQPGNPWLYHPGRYVIPCILVPAVIAPAAQCYANGYNRLGHIAIPLLIIIFALLYGIIAPFPALVIYFIARLAGSPPRFSYLYLGSFLGGEAGILACVALATILAGDGGWNSYHYTLYPWVILGLSLAGAAIGLCLDRRSRKG